LGGSSFLSFNYEKRSGAKNEEGKEVVNGGREERRNFLKASLNMPSSAKSHLLYLDLFCGLRNDTLGIFLRILQ
jgi:hypothetical protein